MNKRIAFIRLGAPLILFATLSAACKPGFAGDQSKQEGAYAVSIDNFSFGPGTLMVPVGTKVTWTNKDDVPHNVISTDKLFASPVLDTDKRFSYTFTKAGTYNYYCSIHPKMTGKVVVR